MKKSCRVCFSLLIAGKDDQFCLAPSLARVVTHVVKK